MCWGYSALAVISMCKLFCRKTVTILVKSADDKKFPSIADLWLQYTRYSVEQLIIVKQYAKKLFVFKVFEATGVPQTAVCARVKWDRLIQSSQELFDEVTENFSAENECAITLGIADGFHQHKEVQERLIGVCNVV